MQSDRFIYFFKRRKFRAVSLEGGETQESLRVPRKEKTSPLCQRSRARQFVKK